MIPKRIILVTVFVIAVALAFVFAFSAKKELAFSDTMAFAQFVFTILAFSAVLYTLYYASAQFRKSMAKPKLEVIFSENGKSEISIDIRKDIPKGVEDKHELKLSIINKGNAITKLFQVDFTVCTLFRPRFDAWSALSLGIPSPPLNPLPNISESERLISFCSYEKVYCFVNKPARIHSLLLGTFTEEYDKYPNQFTITYKIYGDWAETQEGELKVICNKM